MSERHMDTDCVKVYRDTIQDNSMPSPGKHMLKTFKRGERFYFSCLPYTACEIGNATHQEELPPARRTVFCIYGATRGVGEINSCGADAEAPYHINTKEDIRYSFIIS